MCERKDIKLPMENDYKNIRTFIDFLEDKKAKNITVIDIRKLTTIAHYFIIASGTSNTHIKTLADNLIEKLSKMGIRPLRIEGYNFARWILIDYDDVVVHIFHEEDREYYGLERLWQDGELVAIN